MRAFLATLSADAIPADRLTADAALLAAESDLLRAWRARLLKARRRLAEPPAAGPLGLALKVRYLALDIRDGRTDWAKALARHTLADAVRR